MSDPEFTPTELRRMLDDLSLDPVTKHRVELLLSATLQLLAEQQREPPSTVEPRKVYASNV